MTLVDILRQEEPVEPETLEQLGFGKTSLDRQKILAMRVVLHTPHWLEDFNVFENIVTVLNDVEPSVDQVDGVQYYWIWKALKQIDQLLEQEYEFSPEVEAYIRFIHQEAGVLFLPPQVEPDQPILAQVIKRAQDQPLPDQEDWLTIQAHRYLKIQEYLNK